MLHSLPLFIARVLNFITSKNLTPSVDKKTQNKWRCSEISKVQAVFEKISGIGRKVLVKINVLVCPLFSDLGLYHSCGSYSLLSHLRKETEFASSFSSLHSSQLCSPHSLLFANRETNQWGQQDHKSRVGGVDLLRYGSTLTWHVPNKCQRGDLDRESLK